MPSPTSDADDRRGPDPTALALAILGAVLFVIVFFLAADGNLAALRGPVGIPVVLGTALLLLVVPIRLVVRAQDRDDR